MKGLLTMNVGGMFSGKTTELLRQGKRHTLAKEKVIYIKPNIDNRYSDTKIVSHTGESSDYTKSLVIGVDDCLIDYKEVLQADVVLIDEIQFFSKDIVIDINLLVTSGKKVYCSGLDLSFEGRPYLIVGDLMGLADVVQKFKAVCSICGDDAWVTAKREGANSDTVDVGSSDKYIPVCRDCYSKHSVGGVVSYG